MSIDADFIAIPTDSWGDASSTWLNLGDFNFAANRWRGERFPMEPDLVMAITRLLVVRGGRASAVRQVHRNGRKTRLAVRLYLPD